MSAGVVISLEQYLRTDYSPDREFVDGVVVKRHVGELSHSYVQRNVLKALGEGYPELFVVAEPRVQTVEGRCRVPDVGVSLSGPVDGVVDSPPFLVIEILSRRDKATHVLEILDEYVTAGIEEVWVLDPRTKRVYTYSGHVLQESQESHVATTSPSVRLEIAEMFRGL